MFKRATRKNAKLRLAVQGLAGSGKTYSALLIAKEFGSKIAVIDSERGSASLYSDLVPFDVCELDEKNPQDYLEKIKAAAEAGYEVLVIDSMSHSWKAALEMVDKMGGWVRAGKAVSPLVEKIIEAILNYPGHVVATLRSKVDHAVEKDEKTGKATIKRLGTATVAREGTDYEFTVMVEVTREGGLAVTKSRCSALSDGTFTRDDVPKIARILKDWLGSGAPPTPAEAFADRIKFAQNDAELTALVPEMAKLAEEDRRALRALYTAKKEGFAGEG